MYLRGAGCCVSLYWLFQKLSFRAAELVWFSSAPAKLAIPANAAPPSASCPKNLRRSRKNDFGVISEYGRLNLEGFKTFTCTFPHSLLLLVFCNESERGGIKTVAKKSTSVANLYFRASAWEICLLRRRFESGSRF